MTDTHNSTHGGLLRQLTAPMRRDLRDIASGLTRGESAHSCAGLCRRRLVHGDWMTGYYVTPLGAQVADLDREVRS